MRFYALTAATAPVHGMALRCVRTAVVARYCVARRCCATVPLFFYIFSYICICHLCNPATCAVSAGLVDSSFLLCVRL